MDDPAYRKADRCAVQTVHYNVDLTLLKPTAGHLDHVCMNVSRHCGARQEAGKCGGPPKQAPACKYAGLAGPVGCMGQKAGDNASQLMFSSGSLLSGIYGVDVCTCWLAGAGGGSEGGQEGGQERGQPHPAAGAQGSAPCAAPTGVCAHLLCAAPATSHNNFASASASGVPVLQNMHVFLNQDGHI